jgi:hypothetical protein
VYILFGDIFGSILLSTLLAKVNIAPSTPKSVHATRLVKVCDAAPANPGNAVTLPTVVHGQTKCCQWVPGEAAIDVILWPTMVLQPTRRWHTVSRGWTMNGLIVFGDIFGCILLSTLLTKINIALGTPKSVHATRLIKARDVAPTNAGNAVTLPTIVHGRTKCHKWVPGKAAVDALLLSSCCPH